MKEIIVSKKEEGQQLRKLLSKYLSLAPQSFLYKMLRKKNITLNGKKAEGREMTAAGDRICLYLSEDTIRMFGGGKFLEAEISEKDSDMPEKNSGISGKDFGFSVVYEDEHILLVNKPAGMLSQKAAQSDVSLNEKIIDYLLAVKALDRKDLIAFRPGICNRLDRNTSGIVTAGKTMAGLQFLSEAFRRRSLKKYYECIVAGEITDFVFLEGYLKKNTKENKVEILSGSDTPPSLEGWQQAGYEKIQTACRPLAARGGFTLLEVDLITGKPHQIRAQLAAKGHGILGDTKYGLSAINAQMRQRFGINSQLLHAKRLVFGKNPERFSYLNEKEFTAPNPELFERVKRELFDYVIN